MTSSWFSSLILIALVVIRTPTDAANNHVLIQRIEGPVFDEEYFDKGSYIQLRKPTRTSAPGLNTLFNLTKELPSNTRLSIKLFEVHNNQPRPSLVDYDMNLCDYLVKEKRPLFKTYSDALKFPASCPVLPAAYHSEHWKFDDEALPPVIPGPNNWKLTFSYMLKDHALWTHTGYAVIDRSKRNRPKS